MDALKQVMRRAMEAYGGGRLEDARSEFDAALRGSPNDPEALFMRGTVKHQLGDGRGAAEDLRAAVRSRPRFPKAHNNLGIVLAAAGQHDEAAAAFAEALKQDPRYPEAAFNLGNSRVGARDFVGAEASYRRALEIRSDYTDARRELWSAVLEQGRIAEAVAELQRLTTRTPRDPEAWLLLGNALRRATQPDEAEQAYRRALSLRPQWPTAMNNLGTAFADQGRHDKAAGFYQRAVALDGSYGEALTNLGVALRSLGRYADAAAAGRKATRVTPDESNAWLAWGNSLKDQGRTGEAMTAYSEAVRLDPGSAAAHANLGAVRKMRGDPAGAAEACRRALAIKPNQPLARAALVEALMHATDWDALDSEAERLDELVDDALAAGSDELGESPFLSVIRTADPARNLLIAQARSRLVCRRVEGLEIRRRDATAPRTDGPLRIGYLSADFHGHATAHLMAGLFERHDRSVVEVFVYSYGPDDGGPHRRRIVQGSDHFVDVSQFDVQASAQRIHDDGIDILIDLKGHTEHARLEICALRPAPVQATWLGFPGSSGAEFFDYAIVDSVVAPVGEEGFWSETLLRLADCYQVNDIDQEFGPPTRRADHNLPDDAFVFCSFNQPYKIERATWALWMRLLSAVPGSVLWLLAGAEVAHERLRAAASDVGVSPDRVVFAPPINKPKHLARLALADLALDTSTVGGHTTTSDALWAGVPVVSRYGGHFASRVAVSLLRAAGLHMLAAATPSAYEEIALRLAQSPNELSRAVAQLSNREKYSLFDTSAFARKLELSFAEMWANLA